MGNEEKSACPLAIPGAIGQMEQGKFPHEPVEGCVKRGGRLAEPNRRKTQRGAA
jgi:hypothetical protein